MSAALRREQAELQERRARQLAAQQQQQATTAATKPKRYGAVDANFIANLLNDAASALPEQPERPLSVGSQTYQTPALRSVAVGKATNHSNAYLHTTGEAKYTVNKSL